MKKPTVRDRLIKHEVRYFTGDSDGFGGEQECSRSTLLNFLRKPLSDGADFGPKSIRTPTLDYAGKQVNGYF